MTQKIVQLANGPIILLDLKPADVPKIIGLADNHALDLADAILLHLVRENAAPYLVTEDAHLASVCTKFGVTPISPIDAALRQAIATWEASFLPPKGLPRILRRVHQWLSQSHAQAAQSFWSRTGAGSHLP